jgi:hypothetical protein
MAVAAAIAATLLLVAVALVVWAPWGPRSGGPLALPDDLVTEQKIPADVGEHISYGFPLPENLGSTVAILQQVVVPNVPSGLRFLGAGVQLAEENGSFLGSERSFPPDEFVLHPVSGWRVPPGDRHGVGLVLGFVAERGGEFVVPEVEVTYQVGRRDYIATYPFSVVVCAPNAPVGTCGAP